MKGFPPEERDWTKLPPEMLDLISNKLLDLADLARFRTVCWLWRCAPQLPPRSPWFFRNEYRCSKVCKDYMELYNPLLWRGTTIYVNPWREKILIGSWHCYMLISDKQKHALFLLNPLSKKEIALPPIDIHIPWPKLICIRSDPIRSSEYIVMYEGIENSIRFCHVGDEHWKTVQLKACYPLICLYNEVFFVHDRKTKITDVIDIASRSLKLTIPSPKYEWHGFDFFVESCGKVLGLTNLFDYHFLIHELDGNENPQWVQTKDIGDQVLLVHKSTFMGISLKANDFSELKNNCIYYFYEEMQERNCGGSCSCCEHYSSHLVRFDIEKFRYTKLLEYPLDIIPRYFFMPSLQ